MSLSRRALLAAVPVLAAAHRAAAAGPADPRMGERALGRPDARVVVQEWFSMTCTHCAHFSQTVFPEVRAKLIDTGRIRYVFCDFPLDQVALTAAAVARALPPERYEPFVEALLASQDRWAFAPGVDSQAELAKSAALAGMSHAQFQQTVDDQALRQAILDEQNAGQARYKIDSTPSFVFGRTPHSGGLDYAEFARKVSDAAAA